MRMKNLLLTVAAASLLAGPVFADGGPVPEPPAPPPEPVPESEPPAPEPAPPPPAFNWAGPYAGIQIGYLWGDAEHVFSNGAPTDHSDPDGFVAGGHVGFQTVTTNEMLFGIEVDMDWTDAEGDFVNGSGATSSGATDINWMGTARVRMGWVAGGTLLFLTAGGALADVDYSGGPGFAPFINCCGYSDTRFGWVVGGGFEFALSNYLSGRFEYRYTDYGTNSGALDPTFPGVNMDVDLATHQARAALSYHF